MRIKSLPKHRLSSDTSQLLNVEDIGIEEEVVPKKRGRPRSSQVASETKSIQMHSHSLPLRTSPRLASPTQPVENIEDSESGRTSPQTPVLVNHSDVQGEDTNNSSPADVEEVWQHYMTRADYHVFVAGSHTKLGKSKRRTNNADDSEEIATIKRIERAIVNNVKQITTLELFNHTDPLSPGGEDSISVEVHMLACDHSVVLHKEHLGTRVVPSHSGHSKHNPVFYYFIPKEVEEKAENVYFVTKVFSKKLVRFIGGGKREGRARSRITLTASFRRKKSDLIAITEDRIQYGARLIARRRDNIVTPNFGNSSVALFSDMELDFLKSDDWIDNVSRLAELASAGVKRCISGPAAILNYGISDEHVDHDWEKIKSHMKERSSKKNANNKNESGLTVWYNEASPTWSRESSLDKENRPSVKARAGPVSRQLEKVYGFTCPFTRKIFDTLSQLVEYLNLCYPSLRFQVQSVDASSVKFDVFSNVSLAEWAKPPGRLPSEVVFCRPRKKQLEKCGSILSESSKKKSKYQVVKMIENTEMPFVMPKYVRVPGPISTKVYHSVAGNTSKWMDHIMERNIRDYIDVTPAEKEFMLLFNRFRMDYKRELNGKRLKYQFSKMFVEKCGAELTARKLRAHCAVYLNNQVRSGDLTVEEMVDLVRTLHSFGEKLHHI